MTPDQLTIPYIEALRTIYEVDVRVMQEATRKARASRAALYAAMQAAESGSSNKGGEQ